MTLFFTIVFILILFSFSFYLLFIVAPHKNYIPTDIYSQKNVNTNQTKTQQPKSESSLEVKWDANNTTYSSKSPIQSSLNDVAKTESSDDKYMKLFKESITLVHSGSLSFQKTQEYKQFLSLVNSGRGEEIMQTSYDKVLSLSSTTDKWHFRIDMWLKLSDYVSNNKVSPSLAQQYNKNIMISIVGLTGFHKYHNPYNFSEYEKQQMNAYLETVIYGVNALIAHGNMQNMFN